VDPLTFPAVLGTRQRILAGVLGIGLGFGGPFALSIALMASSGDPAFVILPLPFLGALWFLQGLAPVAYRLEDGGVVIARRLMPRRIPYAHIGGVDRTPRPIGGLLALGVNALFGARGPRWNPRTGLHYLAITNTTNLVFLETRRGLMVISPERPDDFARELRRRLPSLTGAPTAASGRGPAPASRAGEEPS
jgi:hypothetical protein